MTRDLPCVPKIRRLLANRTTHFGHLFVLSAQRFYLIVFTADAKLLILELKEALRNGSLRSSICMTVLEKFFRFFYTADMVHSICMVRLRLRSIAKMMVDGTQLPRHVLWQQPTLHR